MPTDYPTSRDVLTNPAAGDQTNAPSHAGQHANANDAIEAIQAAALLFTPIGFETVLSASSAVSIPRTLTPAILEDGVPIPTDTRLVTVHGEISADVAGNSLNILRLFHSEETAGGGGSGTGGDEALRVYATVGSGLWVGFSAVVGVVHSSGAKISYQLDRNAGTITYRLYVSGYWAPAPA